MTPPPVRPLCGQPALPGPPLPTAPRKEDTVTDHRTPQPSARPGTRGTRPGPAPVTVGEVVRWAAFSCGLVPVVLVVCGSSATGAIAVACGLALVTAACRALLLRSARVPPLDPPPDGPTDREGAVPEPGATGRGAHRGGRHGRGRTTPR